MVFLMIRANLVKNHSVKVFSESTVVRLSSILPRLMAVWKRRKSLIGARSRGLEPSRRLCTPVTSTAASSSINNSLVSRFFLLRASIHLLDRVSMGLQMGLSCCVHLFLVASQSPTLILEGLLHVFCIVLDAILHPVSSLLVTVGDGSL